MAVHLHVSPWREDTPTFAPESGTENPLMRAATGSLACIDLSDNDAFVQQVPYGWFEALRRADPVYWQPERRGRGFWAVTSHADMVAVSRDWATFSSQAGASALEDLAPDALAARRSMIDTDMLNEVS